MVYDLGDCIIEVRSEDVEFYETLCRDGLVIYESQDGLTAHLIFNDKTYEMQLEEIADNHYKLKYIKEVK